MLMDLLKELYTEMLTLLMWLKLLDIFSAVLDILYNSQTRSEMIYNKWKVWFKSCHGYIVNTIAY